MRVNIGTLDRALRTVLGVALLVLAFGGVMPALSVGAPKWIAGAAGLILLATAALRLCPLYAIFGIRTCKL